MHDLASDLSVLHKRVQRLLRREASWTGNLRSGGNQEVAPKQLTFLAARENINQSVDLLSLLQEVGNLALIGGAVRDMARSGLGNFRSDLDFVLYEGDVPAFLRLMERLGGIRNRFGGFRLHVEKRRFDVWALEHTWARAAGLRRVEVVHDLLNCTFFDWDAILFDLKSQKVVAKPGYFEALETRVMDVNLLENPNPKGSLVRALRRGILWRVAFGPGLTAFAGRQLAQETWSELVFLEQKAFGTSVLKSVDPTKLQNHFSQPRFENGITEPFGAPLVQPKLPFPPNSSHNHRDQPT